MNPALHAAIQALTVFMQGADDPEDKQVAAHCLQALAQIASKERAEPAGPAAVVAPAGGGLPSRGGPPPGLLAAMTRGR
jgi:hypothetical protein